MDVTDALGRTIHLSNVPKRIVSLVPSQTELLADLGLDAEVVGLTRYCVHPDGWRTRKAVVGGTKKARIDRVAELSPDLILANHEENTREDVEALSTLAPVYVTDVRDLASALAMIEAVGVLVDKSAEALELNQKLRTAFQNMPTYPPLRALYLIWRNPYMTIGRDTFIHDMMARVGLVNVYGEQDRYPALPKEEAFEVMEQHHPDVVLLSSEPYPFAQEHVVELAKALPNTRVCLVDGELFSWYGSRILHTPSYLRKLREEVLS